MTSILKLSPFSCRKKFEKLHAPRITMATLSFCLKKAKKFFERKTSNSFFFEDWQNFWLSAHVKISFFPATTAPISASLQTKATKNTHPRLSKEVVLNNCFRTVKLSKNCFRTVYERRPPSSRKEGKVGKNSEFSTTFSISSLRTWLQIK